MIRQTVILLAVLTVAPGFAAGAGPQRHGDDGANVLFTFTLAGGPGEEGGERPLRVLVLDGERSRTRTGWRVPTATATGSTPDDHAATALRYQDVGLGVNLNGRIVGPGRVRVSGEVELSAIARDQDGKAPPGALGAPTVATFRHVFDVIVADGVSTTLAEAPRPEGGSVTLSLTAEIRD